jgi:hypothetical protein
MEYVPAAAVVLSLITLLTLLFFRSPKEASVEARADYKQLSQEIANVWAAHSALATKYAGSNGTLSAQYTALFEQQKQLTEALRELSREVRSLSVRMNERADRERTA